MTNTLSKQEDQQPTYVCSDWECREWMLVTPGMTVPPVCPIDVAHGLMNFDGRDFTRIPMAEWPHTNRGKIAEVSSLPQLPGTV